jgi:hypothetical protein
MSRKLGCSRIVDGVIIWTEFAGDPWFSRGTWTAGVCLAASGYWTARKLFLLRTRIDAGANAADGLGWADRVFP